MSLDHTDQYTFDSFIVSDCNKEAYMLCRSIVDDTEGKFVAIHGPSPCGKTHLLNAVKKAYQNKYPTRKILTTTFDDLVLQYISSIEKEDSLGFRKYICGYDLLIVDNMQFAAGKSTTQKEFSCWFSAMLDSCKSVIIAWDRPEKCLDVVLRRMRDRYLDRCHILKISEPDIVLREKYFEKLVKKAQLSIPSEVCKCVANSRKISLCAFKGCLIKFKVLQEQKNGPLTRQEMMECLNDYT